MDTLWRSKVSFRELMNANDVCRRLEATYPKYSFVPTVRKDEDGQHTFYGVISYDRLSSHQMDVFDAYVSGFYAAIEDEEWNEEKSSRVEKSTI